MEKIDVRDISKAIRRLAEEALNSLPPGDLAHKTAEERTYRPIDYMRCAEFQAILGYLSIKPGMRILDISSPQFFSLYLAKKHPEAEFRYINVIDSELDTYRKIAQNCALNNLHHDQQDVRGLKFDANSFDKIISISVLEHIYPEVGGDLQALQEIKRVMKGDGELFITVPCKEKRNIVYVDGPVYERESAGKTFFAREYDRQQLDDLTGAAGLNIKRADYIIEKPGLLAMDYYTWGPGKDSPLARYSVKARFLIERLLGKAIDEMLAERYLSLSTESAHRIVNIALCLERAD